MRRRIFTFAAAGSLLMCLGTAMLWVRSYFVGDRFFSSLFRDEKDWTFWRQSSVRVGLGEIGVMSMEQAGPRNRFRSEIEANYRRLNLGAVRALKYSPSPPEYPYANVTSNGGLGFRWWYSPAMRGRFPSGPGFAAVLPLWAI